MYQIAQSHHRVKRPIIGRTDIRTLSVHEGKTLERINIFPLVALLYLYLHIENERSGAFRLDATVNIEKCDFRTNRSIFGLCSKSTKGVIVHICNSCGTIVCTPSNRLQILTASAAVVQQYRSAVLPSSRD